MADKLKNRGDALRKPMIHEVYEEESMKGITKVSELSKIEKARISGEIAAACAILQDVRNQYVDSRFYCDVDEVYQASTKLLRKMSGADEPIDKG